MKIKQVSQVKSTGRAKNKNPILKHKLQKQKLNKSLSKKTETRKMPLTIQEHSKAIQLYLKYYKDGITVKNALDKSLDVDIERARTQLKAFYIRTLQKDVFKFNVKASGLYQATSHEVHLSWDLSKADLSRPSKEIFLNTPIKAQCGCGRHTYYYRYLWTTARAGLGLQEHRFPAINNRNLQGMCCKHMIKVLKSLHSAGFQNTFGRYIENKHHDKHTHISQKDKTRIAGQSFNS